MLFDNVAPSIITYLIHSKCTLSLTFNTPGPQTNPANLPLPPTIHTALPITDLLTTIFLSATNNTPTTLNPTRFLSRYDKSANNILESSLWASIGQTPWSEPYSHWYHRYVEFPVRALECASKLGEYTIVDWGTWWTVGEEIRKEMVIFVSAFFVDSSFLCVGVGN